MKIFKYIRVIGCLIAVIAFPSVVEASEGGAALDSLVFTRSPYERINPKKAASDYYMRGKESFVTEKNRDLAVRYYSLALKLNPEHAAANYEFANHVPANVGLRYSLKANEIDKNNYWYANQLAEIYLSLRRIDEATKVAKRLVKINPKSEDAYQKLSTYYYYGNKPDSAYAIIDSIKNRFGISPETAYIHTNMMKSSKALTKEMLKKIEEYGNSFDYMAYFNYTLGVIYLQNREVEKAIDNFKKALAAEPQDYGSSLALFDIFTQMRNQGEAVKYLASVFRYPDMDIEKKLALYKEMVLSNIFLYQNFFTYVSEASKALIETYPDDVRVLNDYTKHLLNIGEVDNALDLNIKALDRGVYDTKSLILIIEILVYKKDFEAAHKYIDKGLELLPAERREFNKINIYTLSEEKRYSEVITALRSEIKTIKTDSLRGEYWGYLGDAYHAAGKSKASFKAYEKSLKYLPDNVIVLNNYAYYLSLEDKKLEKALGMALRAMNIETSNATYIDTYAWILYKLGRYNEAREVMAKAVALDTTKSPTLFLHYGDILDKLGERDLAEMYWQKALESGADAKDIEERLDKSDKI